MKIGKSTWKKDWCILITNNMTITYNMAILDPARITPELAYQIARHLSCLDLTILEDIILQDIYWTLRYYHDICGADQEKC